MMRSLGFGLVALALGVASGGLLYACGSDDTGEGAQGQGAGAAQSGGGGQGAGAGHTSSGGHGGGLGGSGGSAAAGGSGEAGSGGTPLTGPVACLEVCTAIHDCAAGGGGSGGIGGSGGSSPLEPCLDPCNTAVASCTSAELVDVLACLSPNITPNCDQPGYFACANNVACVD